MIALNIGGKELPIAFTLYAIELIEEETGAPFDVEKFVHSIANRKTVADAVRIMAKAAAETAEDEKKVPDTLWLKKHIAPGDLNRIGEKLIKAVMCGMRMETAEPDDGPVDVVLEEIEKKETRGG